LHIPPDNLGELPLPKGDPSFELKPLPQELKYAYLDEKNIYPVLLVLTFLLRKRRNYWKRSKLTEQPLDILLMILKAYAPLYACIKLI
jgi:hypothetical protein